MYLYCDLLFSLAFMHCFLSVGGLVLGKSLGKRCKFLCKLKEPGVPNFSSIPNFSC